MDCLDAPCFLFLKVAVRVLCEQLELAFKNEFDTAKNGLLTAL